MAAPAKKAAAKKTTAAKTAAPAKQPPQNILYTVPEGWSYEVDLIGPGGATIGVTPSDEASGHFSVIVTVDGNERRSTASSMPEALRAASKAAKALADVAKKRAALQAAEEEALGFLVDKPTSGSAGATKKAASSASLDDVD